MAPITQLSFGETMRPDASALAALRAELGHPAAERQVGHVFDDLGEALGDLVAAYHAGDVERIAVLAQDLVAPCERVGMSTMARVMRDVCVLRAEGAGASFAAVSCRLIRLIESSLAAVCEMPDMRV